LVLAIMSTADLVTRPPFVALPAGTGFAATFTGFVAVAAMLAAALPLELSIAIVFLFAGPHNLLEARYMIGRLPARAGRLRPFVVVACGGAFVLASSFAALPWAAAACDGRLLHAAWNAVFIGWVATLVVMRSRTRPRFDATWVPPAALVVVLLQWPWPSLVGLALVFGHPLMALAVLHRELRRSRPEWLPAWRMAAAAVPLGACAVWAATSLGSDLVVRSSLESSIVRHAGVDVLAFAPARGVVATHAFLELVHYGVWIVMLPLIGLRSPPWRIDTVPLARRGLSWARGVAAVLGCGVLAVVVLWACFCLDYETTRHVYFTIAVLHVLAEIPFLLRMP
jgi:hypothetical protein